MNVIVFLCASLDSSTVQLHDSLVEDVHARVQWLVSVVKKATVLEECTIEEQRCFCGQNDSMQRIFIKKYFLFTVGTVYRVKRFATGSRNVANISLMTKGSG
jgi:hypothetical protein